jgi:hypothetical protein
MFIDRQQQQHHRRRIPVVETVVRRGATLLDMKGHSEKMLRDLLIGILMDSKRSIPFYVLICFPNLKLCTSLQTTAPELHSTKREDTSPLTVKKGIIDCTLIEFLFMQHFFEAHPS